VLRLVAAEPAGAAPLADFAQYLRAKGRAGMVALPPGGNGGGGGTGGAPQQRALYLLPPSEAVCRQLGVAWPDAAQGLLLLLVPAPGPR
jgi:hypothetical protein